MFKTNNFKETQWKFSTFTNINKEKIKIDIYYSENRDFNEEEKDLIKEIINRLKFIIKRKKAEDDLRHFIAIVSHELRTPITVMVQSKDVWKKYEDNRSLEYDILKQKVQMTPLFFPKT